MTTWAVSGSSTRESRISAARTSDCPPIEANREMPSPLRAESVAISVPSCPDWVTTASEPGVKWPQASSSSWAESTSQGVRADEASTGGDDSGCEVLGVRHAGGDDEEGAHAGGQGLVDGGGHRRSGDGDDEQFGDRGQLRQMRERRLALDRGGPGGDERSEESRVGKA